MTEKPNQQKKGLNNQKIQQLLVDIILVALSIAFPHATFPLALIALIRIGFDFHQSRKEDDEESE